MGNDPAIKGTGFGSVVADLEAAVESGHLTAARIEERLQPMDLKLLEGKVLPGDWCSIESYGRILDLLCDAVGGGSAAYHVMRGQRAAERLTSSGIYHQLDKAQRLKGDTRVEWRDDAARVMLTMSGALFNFMEWTFERDPDREGAFTLTLTGAEALPEAGRHTLQGVIEYTTEAITGGAARAESTRPEPGRIVFRAISTA